MAKKVYFIVILLNAIVISAQVGINSATPSATLDVVSTGSTATSKSLEVNNSSGTELFTILDNGNVGVNIAAPTNKIHISSTSDPIRLEGLQTSNTTDQILTVDAIGIVKKMTRFDLGLSQSVFFTVPATTWNTAGATKSWMTNLTTGTATTTERSLYESLSATDKAKMITFEGLRLDALNYLNAGTYIRPKLFNTTASTINYTLTAQHITNEASHVNANVNAGLYNYRVDGDDIIFSSNSQSETLLFDVYFNSGIHYHGNISCYRISNTYYFFMNITKL